MNAKFSIGIVVAIVLQVSGFVWWIAQQSQTIDTLKNEVAELTARTEVEKEVTLINDVEQLKKDVQELSDKTKDAILDVLEQVDKAGQHTDTRVEGLGEYTDTKISNLVADLQKLLIQHEQWIDELEAEDEAIYESIQTQLLELDKKLSDRIKESLTSKVGKRSRSACWRIGCLNLGPSPVSKYKPKPIASGIVKISLNKIAASKSIRRRGCIVTSVARAVSLHKLIKSPASARVALYSGK